MAKRTGLLRMAGAGCARSLVHARRRCAGRWRFSAKPWFVAASTKNSLISSAAITKATTRGDGSFRTDRSGCTSSWSALRGSGRFCRTTACSPIPALQTGAGECLLDEEGRLYIASPQGLGLVHSQDMVLAAEAVEQGSGVPRDVMSADLPVQYGFVRSPAKSQRR